MQIEAITNSIPSNTRIIDYLVLLKIRIVYLVIFSTWVGMVMAPQSIHPFIALIALACSAIGAGGASAINMWYDRDIDALMKRTQKRPLPSGYITPESALEIGVTLSFFSVLIMAFAVNYLTAFLLAFSIFFYSVVYTIWLKRATSQNIVIGGLPGAFPPLIGWAAVSNNISLESLVLFAIIFLWTPPHFWALSIKLKEEYKKANIPMLPITHGVKYTEQNIIYYSIALIITTIVPYFIGMSSYIYLIGALILGSKFIYKACTLHFIRSDPIELFKYSIFYLFLLFTFMIVDQLVY